MSLGTCCGSDPEVGVAPWRAVATSLGQPWHSTTMTRAPSQRSSPLLPHHARVFITTKIPGAAHLHTATPRSGAGGEDGPRAAEGGRGGPDLSARPRPGQRHGGDGCAVAGDAGRACRRPGVHARGPRRHVARAQCRPRRWLARVGEASERAAAAAAAPGRLGRAHAE